MMGEYTLKTCGACPNKGVFQKAPDVSPDYLEKSTVPKPEVIYQDRAPFKEQHHGVPSINLPPDLTVPATIIPTTKHGDCRECCTRSEQQNEKPCPDSAYVQEKRKENQPIKGIMKKTEPQSKSQKNTQLPTPTPEASGAIVGPCYLPQPQDGLPIVEEDGMEPIGPWATGRIDWSPIYGISGIRPVVDKYSIARYSEAEWRLHNKEILDLASQTQHRSNLVDWNGRRSLEQTRADVDKNQEDSTKRLNQRERDTLRWKCELELAIAAASEEIGLLEAERRRLKTAAAVLALPASIAGECLERRTSRYDLELVRDEVEEELIKEVALIAEIRELFARALKDTELQLEEDKTAKQKLEFDWCDKFVSHQMEVVNCALNNKSNIMLFKPGATVIPDDQSTKEHWEHFTRENLQEGESTRQRSVTLRGTLNSVLSNASRDLRAQADRVDLALRRRISCTEQIRIELENSLKNVLQRLANSEDLIRDIRDAIKRMNVPMKKAQTRLDNRLLRPRVEHCRDDAHYGLIEEVKSIAENVTALSSQLKITENNQAELIKVRGELEKEIVAKRKTLDIDRNRIQLIRSHYPSPSALAGN